MKVRRACASEGKGLSFLPTDRWMLTGIGFITTWDEMLPANGFNAERRRQGMDFHLPFEGMLPPTHGIKSTLTATGSSFPTTHACKPILPVD